MFPVKRRHHSPATIALRTESPPAMEGTVVTYKALAERIKAADDKEQAVQHAPPARYR